MGIKTLLNRVEKTAMAAIGGSIEIKVIHDNGDPDCLEKKIAAVRLDYKREHGSLAGLRIISTRMPGPDPLPGKYRSSGS